MQLKSFRVRVFRNVIDSGDIDVGDSTCLVGKNEAGKSSIIEALHRLNPSKPCPLVLLDDYPRWLKKAHEISGEIEGAVPIKARYELSDEEFAKINDKFEVPVLLTKKITASRKYHGEIEISAELRLLEFTNYFISTHVGETLRQRLTGLKTSSELITKLDEISKEVEEKQPTEDAKSASEARTKLNEILGKGNSLTSAVAELIKPLIPKTFYFGQYSQLDGRYDLAEVLPAVKSGSGEDDIQTAADFLRLAKVDPDNVEKWDFEQSNAELEAISSLLTQKVKANWKQNQHLKLGVKIETIPSPHQNHPPNRFLQFRVEDTRHDFTSRLDRRSTGFRWFVSFIASFFEFEKDKTIILLLDEPGLSLHARAQKDLLDAIDTNLTNGRQVIYTTHSPFMVRTEALDRVRIVEDKGPEDGSVVTNDAGKASDPDTLFPLQAALGYDIAQNLFIGNRNILLEGTSDFMYLTMLSSHLGSLGRSTLPEDSRLLPAGGATNIPTFLALLGTQLQVVVLLDGKAQRQKIDNAIAQGRLDANRVLSIEKFCQVKGADIEDLFTPEEYLNLYNATFKKKVKLKDIEGDDRIVKRIERAAGGAFDHGRVAGYFLAKHAEIIPNLSSETIKRFEALIAELGKALPAAPGGKG